ncbi:MAG: 50S ribosomal protein L11 methyltransferase [Sphingorhabdus sp.]
MSASWKLTLPCSRDDAELLSGELPRLAMMEPPPALMTSEVEEFGDEWILEAFFEQKPDLASIKLLASLIPGTNARDGKLEMLPDADWVTISQQGLEPLHVGRFFVHTHSGQAPPDGTHALRIEASQAFGTGHHETTAGCLAMLDQIEKRRHHFRHIADVGTGTGLLAFAALHLWPHARCLASDIDPVAVEVAKRFALENGVALGRGPGQLALVTASGSDHPVIRRRAPYDLLIANILAGPLIELAPGFARLVKAGGTLILAGLLGDQCEGVTAAYMRQGFLLAERVDSGDWPALRFKKRRRYGWRRRVRATGRTSQSPGDFGEW